MAKAKKSLQERFEAVDAAHPEIYEAFRALAIKMLRRGVRHYGAKAIMEVVRYHRAVSMAGGKAGGKATGAGSYKINNSFVAFYARKLADEDARFARFFEFRTQRRSSVGAGVDGGVPRTARRRSPAATQSALFG